jgi:hypothetical protein
MFRILNNESPKYLRDGISKMHEKHKYNTRSGEMALFKPKLNTQGQNTFLYTAISQWNSLPKDVQSETTKEGFKKKVKKYLLHKLTEDF